MPRNTTTPPPPPESQPEPNDTPSWARPLPSGTAFRVTSTVPIDGSAQALVQGTTRDGAAQHIRDHIREAAAQRIQDRLEQLLQHQEVEDGRSLFNISTTAGALEAWTRLPQAQVLNQVQNYDFTARIMGPWDTSTSQGFTYSDTSDTPVYARSGFNRRPGALSPGPCIYEYVRRAFEVVIYGLVMRYGEDEVCRYFTSDGRWDRDGGAQRIKLSRGQLYALKVYLGWNYEDCVRHSTLVNISHCYSHLVGCGIVYAE